MATLHHQVVIVGGGSGGIATASSMLGRDPSLDIAIVEPTEVHYYQPGWTMVGAGVFEAKATRRARSGSERGLIDEDGKRPGSDESMRWDLQRLRAVSTVGARSPGWRSIAGELPLARARSSREGIASSSAASTAARTQPRS